MQLGDQFTKMALHQFDYVFALGMMFAFLDAWNIGANDVANSWATSVAAKALTYPQAMVLAAIMEFLGAVLAGSRVTSTIRNNIVDVERYREAPAGLMLLMACALVGSSTWLTIATRIGAPVSATHSIVGGIIGAGIAASGGDSVHWGWKGFAKIVASWFIAPLVAGGFAMIIFYVTKYGVLERGAKALRNGMFMMPVYFFITIAILTMSVVWKGAPNLNLDDLSDTTVALAIVITGLVGAVLYVIFALPYFYRKLVLEDWTLKWWEIVYGPLLLRRSKEIPPMPAGHMLVIDYYDKSSRTGGTPANAAPAPGTVSLSENDPADTPATFVGKEPDLEECGDLSKLPTAATTGTTAEPDGYKNGKFYRITKYTWPELKKPRNWHHLLVCIFLNGVRQDVLQAQLSDTGPKFLNSGVKKAHAVTKRYDLKVEHIYSFLQCLTAATASWSHGSNDISNACGPLATIFQVWKYNSVGAESDGKEVETPIWILCYAAAALVIGLWTYGYHLMRNLGNKFILQSPSRGFSTELGAAITTIFSARLGLPISTTQCIIGATLFVGLANNNLHAVNWSIVLWSYCGWFLTVPCAGLIAGLLMGIITNAPKLGYQYQMTS